MILDIKDFSYNLQKEQIATYPLENRDQSKLLVYDRGQMRHKQFFSIADDLPIGGLLVFNDTKVIPARLRFPNLTGAIIEIFLLNPLEPSHLVMEAMQAERVCSWKCAIGNLKRWKNGTKLEHQDGELLVIASLENRDEGIVKFAWNTNHNFASLVGFMGETPLPPYLKRKAEASDRERYQTVYSRYDGAVAAPTAGLHFTPSVFESLKRKNIQTDFITLHVSAGTFQPIKTKDPTAHKMHGEQLIVSQKNIETLLQHNHITAVGTTSLRTLESLYWYGVKLLNDENAPFIIHQGDPYKYTNPVPSREKALTAILANMSKHNETTLFGETSIYIFPGYTFQNCDALITNFHQPGSSLILLVAAFIGEDWRTLYEEALANQYRFLSYGDSSLMIPRNS